MSKYAIKCFKEGIKQCVECFYPPALHFGKEPTAYNTSTVKKKGN